MPHICSPTGIESIGLVDPLGTAFDTTAGRVVKLHLHLADVNGETLEKCFLCGPICISVQNFRSIPIAERGAFGHREGVPSTGPSADRAAAARAESSDPTPTETKKLSSAGKDD